MEERFYGRENELKLLNQIRITSEKSARFTLLTGRRRIGKTTLLKKAFEGREYTYLFVSRNSEAVLCQQFQKAITESLNLDIAGQAVRFSDLFRLLMKESCKRSITVVIDEFQDFNYVNQAIFSEIQNIWDEFKNQSKMNLIVCGSIFTLMKTIFEDAKEPLFGRITDRIELKPFPIKVIKAILKDNNPSFENEDLLFFYLLTGGVARLVADLMDRNACTKEKMLESITQSSSPFLTEGRDTLILEMGKEYGIYFSILLLIANGKKTQSEIDSIIEKNTGTYLKNLCESFRFINQTRPAFSKPNSRNIRWEISDNYLNFYFRFIYPNQDLVEIGKLDMLRKAISIAYDTYSGKILERYFKQKISEEEDVTSIGAWWDRKGENEIDIIAINRFEKAASIIEVKRNEEKFSRKILQSKSELIRPMLDGYSIKLQCLSMSDM